MAHDNKSHACFLASCVLVSVRLFRLQLVGPELRQYGQFLVSPSLLLALSLSQETKRLTKMSEDKAVAATKRETFLWRLNILSSFAKFSDKSEL